jgi:hypothetical protein
VQARQLCVVIVIAGAASTHAAQTTTSQRKPSTTPPLTLSGCVQRSETGDRAYTLVDPKDKTTYRLTGPNLGDYIGRRVLIVGGVAASKRLHIAGGLTPTPNVAAQAGAMDPSQAATARAGGSGPGTGPPPTLDFRIKSIRPAEGGCPE